MNLSERLAAARKERSMTQREVAERLNVSFQAVSLWERGETVGPQQQYFQYGGGLFQRKNGGVHQRDREMVLSVAA